MVHCSQQGVQVFPIRYLLWRLSGIVARYEMNFVDDDGSRQSNLRGESIDYCRLDDSKRNKEIEGPTGLLGCVSSNHSINRSQEQRKQQRRGQAACHHSYFHQDVR